MKGMEGKEEKRERRERRERSQSGVIFFKIKTHTNGGGSDEP